MNMMISYQELVRTFLSRAFAEWAKSADSILFDKKSLLSEPSRLFTFFYHNRYNMVFESYVKRVFFECFDALSLLSISILSLT